MRLERRQPTKAELGRITSPGLVIRRVRLPKRKATRGEQKRKKGRLYPLDGSTHGKGG
jgi:hypothetical protein